MRKLAAFFLLASFGCVPPTNSKKDKEIVFVTYSAPAVAEGVENWTFALFQGGLEEMLAKEQSALMELVTERSEAVTKIDSKLMVTEIISEEARPESYSRLLSTKALRREAKTDIGVDITKSEASKTEASQKTGKENIAGGTERTEADPSVRKNRVEQGVNRQEIQQSVLLIAINTAFYQFIMEQFIKGNLVLSGAKIRTLLQNSELKVQQVVTSVGGGEGLDHIWAVDRSVSVLKVTKTAGKDSDFADLSKASKLEGSHVLTYSLRVKNTAKTALTGVILVDRLPEKLSLDRDWVSAPMMKRMSAEGKAVVEIIREEKETTVVWNLQQPLDPDQEMTFTFGAVIK